MRKPDPRIYKLVLDRLSMKANETVFLDDLGMNLKPAAAMGINTIKVCLDLYSLLYILVQFLSIYSGTPLLRSPLLCQICGISSKRGENQCI